MDRRHFILASTSAFFSSLIGGWDQNISALAQETLAPFQPIPKIPIDKSTGVPYPEITAAVDIIVPADPDVPGDFKGSDYGADRVVAEALTDFGQMMVVSQLNQYAGQVAGKDFIKCSPGEQLDAIKAWVRTRKSLVPIIKDLLSGLLTYANVGTYEGNSEAEQLELFEAMGWYDPQDPTGTFSIPCNGYPDSFIFPTWQKKGLRQ